MRFTNMLSCFYPQVQEKALLTIPQLLDVLDVGSVQDVLFVQVAVSVLMFFCVDRTGD